MLRPVLVIALLFFLFAGRIGHAQMLSPAETAPTPSSNEPALPTDSTAPSTVGTPAATSIPLIPSQPLGPLDSAPFPATPTSPAAATAPLPATLPADPMAIPAAANPVPTAEAATKTNNIGTARRFQYDFALTLGTTFDDNIFLEPSANARGDVFFSIQPSISLGFGGGIGGGSDDNRIRFRYSPQALIYVSHPDLDTVQHFVNLTGTYHFSRLTLSGTQDVQILDNTDVGNPHPYAQNTASSPTGVNDGNPSGGTSVVNSPSSSVNLDVGQRTRLNLFTTSLLANYYVSDKVSYDLSGQLGIADYAGDLISTRTLSGSGFFSYSPTGKTTVSLGVTAGYVFSDPPNPDQSFEQANLRFSYTPSSKLVATGQIGLEFRQSSADQGTQFTPVFDLSVLYAPFDGTTISLAANRQVQTSAVLGGQDYTITGFTLGLGQRFLQRIFARLNIGFTHSDYVSQVSNVTADRTDDYFFVQPGLDYNLRENIVVGLFYNHRASNSSQQIRTFSDNQAGLRLSFAF